MQYSHVAQKVWSFTAAEDTSRKTVIKFICFRVLQLQQHHPQHVSLMTMTATATYILYTIIIIISTEGLKINIIIIITIIIIIIAIKNVVVVIITCP